VEPRRHPAAAYTRRVRAARDLSRLALAFAALALAACAPEPTGPPHLVLALIDTLRRDHLGSYGYPRETSPFIDSLAARGLVFERVVAQAPWTGASMASLWTSRHPSEVGGIVLPDEAGLQELGRTPVARLVRGTPTLAGQLRQAGYRTRAFVANPWAGDAVGLLDGFEQVVEQPLDARGLVDAALARLRADLAEPGPLFLYLHFRDVHEPVAPPEPYRSLFPGLDGHDREPAHARWRFGDAPDPEAPEVRLFRSHKIALYDGALRFVDDELRRLAAGLDAAGLGSHTLFAIASDHGEAFWEHARFERRVHLDPRGLAGIGHGHSLFGELLEVPLILAGPGVPARRVATPVHNLDLAPTLLGRAGASPLPGARGRDLVRALAEQRLTAQPAFSENIAYGPEARSLTGERYKLIRYRATREGPKEVWIDRSAAPGERPQAALDDLASAGRLRARLDALERELGPASAPEPVELDPEQEAALRALGYGE
jgi:arylsulfatase A-like enzyme